MSTIHLEFRTSRPEDRLPTIALSVDLSIEFDHGWRVSGEGVEVHGSPDEGLTGLLLVWLSERLDRGGNRER